MKYVIIRTKMPNSNLIRELPIIFPNDLTHAEVAAAILRGVTEARGGIPISAGTINSFDMGIPHGGSATLGMNSRVKDEKIIQLCDYDGAHITMMCGYEWESEEHDAAEECGGFHECILQEHHGEEHECACGDQQGDID